MQCTVAGQLRLQRTAPGIWPDNSVCLLCMRSRLLWLSGNITLYMAKPEVI